jgi:CDP-glycerol glycerophosphotransferase (TagB/SpsB family)
MATSRVIVLDTYSLLACALTHRRQLRVVQLWHALGAFKKFGWAVVDKEEGWAAQSAIPARALSRLLHMHRGYTDIVVSHSNFIGFYAEAFNADPSVFRVAWLPRVDLMRDQTKVTDLRTRILAAHPELEGQKVVMYAPTIRRPPIDPTAVSALIDAVSDSTWKLIVKMHPIRGQQTPSTTAGAARVDLPDFSAFELIAIADAVITDYSAITYEAYLRGTPVYFYTPDMADYDQARGFYTSPDQFPARTYTDPQDLVRDLESGVVDHIGIRDFVATFLEDSDRRVDLLDLIVSKRQ